MLKKSSKRYRTVIPISIMPKNKEQLHKEDLERIAKYRPLDDDFMRELFRDNKSLTELVLRIITGKNDLTVTSQKTQYDLN